MHDVYQTNIAILRHNHPLGQDVYLFRTNAERCEQLPNDERDLRQLVIQEGYEPSEDDLNEQFDGHEIEWVRIMAVAEIPSLCCNWPDDECECRQEIDEPRMYLNHYYCADCNISWSMEHDCTCDDKCSNCNAAYTPVKSEDI